MVVGGGVPFYHFHAVEQAVVLPGSEALVQQAVRQEGRFQDTRGVLDNAVLDALEAVFPLEDAVLFVQDDGELHVFVNPALALRFAHARPLLFPGNLGLEGGIGHKEGVYAGPDEGVAFRFQGVYHQFVGVAVLGGYVPLVQEGVRKFEAVRHLHGVPGIDCRDIVLCAKEVFLLREAVPPGADAVFLHLLHGGSGQAVQGVPWGQAIQGRTLRTVLLQDFYQAVQGAVERVHLHGVPLGVREPGMQHPGAVHFHAQRLRCHPSGHCQREQDVCPQFRHILQIYK